MALEDGGGNILSRHRRPKAPDAGNTPDERNPESNTNPGGAGTGQPISESGPNRPKRGAGTKKRGRPGPVRRGRSLGRYPWLTWAMRYIKEGVRYWSPETVERKRRGLVRIGNVLKELQAAGMVSTSNPEKLTARDVEAFDRWNQERGLKISSRCRDNELIKGVTVLAGNPVVELMRQRPGKSGLPKRPSHGPKISFTEGTVLEVMEKAKERAQKAKLVNEWKDVTLLGCLVIENGFGFRPRELRPLLFGDLILSQYKIRVNHPKGEGHWSDGDWVTIIPTFAPYLLTYIELRAKYLRRYGVDPNEPKVPMVPKLREGAVGTYTEKQIAHTHRQFAKVTGVDLRPKDGRTSFGQNLIDHGFSVDEVSKRMRHATVATTQNFYIELRPDDDFERLKARYERAEKAQFRRIEQKDEQILYR